MLDFLAVGDVMLDVFAGAAPAEAVHAAVRVREAGPDVEVLAEHDGEPVLLRQDRFLVAAFHPELTEDTRVHKLFLDGIREAAKPPVRVADRGRGTRGNREVPPRSERSMTGA